MPFLFILGLAAFASAFSLRAVDPMLNILAADLGVSLAQVAVLASAFTLPYAAFQLVFGPIGDAVGKLRLVRVNLTVLALGLAGSALAGSHEVLLVTRVFSGAFAGGIIPVVLAMVGDRVSFDQRPVALSRILLALVLGQLSGSALSGFIAAYAGWRDVFWAASALAAVAALACMLGMKELQTRGPLSFGTSIARYGVVLRNPLSIKVYGVVALEGIFTFGAFPMMAPLMVAHGFGDAVEAGLMLGGFAVGGAFYSFAVPVLVRALGLGGMAGVGAATVGLLLMATAVAPMFALALGMFTLAGFCFYMIHNVLQILATELAPEARGSALALFATSFFVGQAVGAILHATVADRFGPTAVFVLCGVVMVAIAWPASRLAPRGGAVGPAESE
ncbi:MULTISPECIES: MFS transporter [unclassified Xanthobacter]|uniref:MFS transporter n=1 Tax=unclassified Xanthobacter TaxID=2623496 RepID=UPI001EE05112|nr:MULTISPECIES: MFS transporter [unclassified Xanthobacter]